MKKNAFKLLSVITLLSFAVSSCGHIEPHFSKLIGQKLQTKRNGAICYETDESYHYLAKYMLIDKPLGRYSRPEDISAPKGTPLIILRFSTSYDGGGRVLYAIGKIYIKNKGAYDFNTCVYRFGSREHAPWE